MFFRLSQECKKLKNKAVCKNITIDSQQGQILVNSAKKKRQKTSLLKLKELATDRQYLSSLMKKYAGEFHEIMYWYKNLQIW